MNRQMIFKQLKKHSPVALSVAGSIGVVCTALSAIKATPKALELINDRKQELADNNPDLIYEDLELSKKDLIKTTWKCYIPTVLIGSLTIFAIVGSNVMSNKNHAALVSAYILLKDTHQKYKWSVRDIFGDDADTRVQANIMAEQTKNNDITISMMAGVSQGIYVSELETEPTMFYESFSGGEGRYFYSTITKVMNAQYNANRNYAIGGYLNLNDLYSFLGLEQIAQENVGWSMDDYHEGFSWIDFENTFVVMEDGLEVCVINSILEPSVVDF